MAGMKVVPEWYKVGGGFFPLDDRSEFNITIETPPGSNLAYTRAKALEADRQIRERRGRALHLRDARRPHVQRGRRRAHVRAAHAEE